MGKGVAIVGKGEARSTEKSCSHQVGNTRRGFTNIAPLSAANDAARSVFVNGKAVILVRCSMPSSGCQGSSPAPNQNCTIKTSSNSVFAEGSGIVRKGDKTSHDGGNASGEITDGSDNVFTGD